MYHVPRSHVDDRLPAVRLDAVRVKQAILNLLANALEAMPAGGTLTVSGFRRPSEGPAGSDSAAAAAGSDDAERGGWVELAVADSGGGIALARSERIFEPFFTTKEGGTGLGLTVVRRGAQQHGGRVEVDNRPGDGATFRLWLPIRQEGGDEAGAGGG